MMIECPYTQSISRICLSQESKDMILTNLYDAYRQLESKKDKSLIAKVKTTRGKSHTAKNWVTITAVCLVAVIFALSIIAFGIAGLGTQELIVANPIDNQTRLDFINTTNNAQYLPNTYLLSAEATVPTNSAGEETSLLAMSDEVRYDSQVEQKEVEDSVLIFDKIDYDMLNDKLGNISAGLHGYNMTVDDIKGEVRMILEIIPGFDQWFKLPYEMPHLLDRTRYSNYKYKVSYNSQKSCLTIQRLLSTNEANVYDSDNRMLYTSQNSDCWQSELLEIDFYYEQGKEVVECTNTRYYYFKGSYYPVCTEYLKNVKDTSTTKLSLYYTVENHLLGHDAGRAFVLQDRHDYGVVAKFVQLDYVDSNDISLLKLTKTYPTLFNAETITTNLSFYRKHNNDMTYYVNAWDYYDKQNSIYTIELDSMFDMYLESYLSKESVTDSLKEDELYHILTERYCDLCIEADYPSSDLVKSCDHIAHGETITRNHSQHLFNTSSKYEDMTLVEQDIATQLYRLNLNVNNIDKDFAVDESKGYYDFEYAIDAYIYDIAKQYVDYTYNFDNCIELIRQANTYTSLSNEYIYTKLLDRQLLIDEVKSSSTFNEGVLNYNVQVVLSDATPNDRLEYYVALMFVDYRGDDDDYEVLIIDEEQIRLYSASRTIFLQGEIGIQDIALKGNEQIDEECSGYLSVGIIRYDDNKKPVLVSAYNQISVSGDNEHIRQNGVDNQGNYRSYYFNGGTQLYYRVYIYPTKGLF